MTGHELRISVLGPVRAWRGGAELDLGTPQQRAVLTTLVLREGRHATRDALIDAVWGDDPPRTSAVTVRTYISRLRQALGDGVIVTGGGGYLLRLESATLDLADFGAALARARAATAAGEHTTAARSLREADALWQGPALADIPGAYADAQRTRLERERQAAREDRLRLDVDSPLVGAAVTELSELVDQHPLDEGLRGLLMLGLYRTGRQAAAIEQYQRIATLLADELGLDPGSGLRQVYKRILDGEPATPPVPAPPAAPAPVPPVATAPEQLPIGIRDFVGRADLVDRLTALLLADGTSTPVAGLTGLGGMGSSTLAVHVARQIRPAFPDGQVYADLRGTAGNPVEVGTVLARFLRAFGVADAAIPRQVAERAALWRSVSCGRRVLVLLDHVQSAEQVRPLLPADRGSAVILTGSRRIPDLPVTRWFRMPVFGPEESLELFRQVTGRDRVDAETAAALRFAEACSHLPLAVRLGAERLADRPDWPIAAIGERLRVEMRQPVAVHEDCIRVEAPFERDLAALRAVDPLSAVAFGLVALPDGDEATVDGAARLLDLPATEAERMLEVLVDAHLIEPAGYQHYRYLSIVRWFARRKAIAAHTPEYRDAVVARLGDRHQVPARRPALRAV
ncbi:MULTISPECIES: BTAD domain-containing putative transcriptional regulator [Actinoplanes]|uniref:AfsR/SARP family transcriptional regulator n=1 Tax=Actinoplanes TaxID=1865 RepID=UPI000698978E|nr:MULTISPECIES: BTAD domain-containing putative transcriptional regulator [Actinoplanes]GLY02291.1 hypothetical protein Acsp01_26700 [Actinoplanes sp. NBRC 101535]